jgi:D-threonate/D-erythronate kinase
MPAPLRLLADDLTGALDTAAEFVGLCGAIEALWVDCVVDDGASIALDGGTREKNRHEAVAITSAFGKRLREGTIAYKKVDSLMRGHWSAELAACIRVGGWKRCVVAPAFAYQGRRTEGGQQFSRGADGSWAPVDGSIIERLAAEGLRVVMARPGDSLKADVTVYDAASEEDLRRVVAAGWASGETILWCGSGGLAQALAHGTQVPTIERLKAPVLGLFGSDQPVTRAQLEACGSYWFRLSPRSSISAARLTDLLGKTGIALASFDLPTGIARAEAARTIASEIEALVSRPERPGTLFVAGGETLKALCLATGARSLTVVGSIVPGLPCSIMRGGLWDGVELVSKSGAFGPENLWRDLLRDRCPAYEDMRP